MFDFIYGLIFPLETFPNLNDSNLLAPAGGIGILVWFIYHAAKNYKEGRKLDVAAAEERERLAEERAERLEKELRKELQSLRDQFTAEKKERNENEATQEHEIKKLRRRVNTLSRINYEFRQIIIEGGLEHVLDTLPVSLDEDDAG